MPFYKPKRNVLIIKVLRNGVKMMKTTILN